MKNLHCIACIAFTFLLASAAAPRSIAQNIWSHSSYAVNSYIEQEATGTGTAYTVSGNANNGMVYGYGAGTDDEEWGTGWGEANFSVVYTWHGSPTPGSLTVQAEGDCSGNVIETTGTADATGMVDTDSAGALHYSNTALPNFAYNALGLVTTWTTPSSPTTLYITGSGEADYSGYAQGAGAATVYFK